jgi:hypothetical protein
VRVEPFDVTANPENLSLVALFGRNPLKMKKLSSIKQLSGRYSPCGLREVLRETSLCRTSPPFTRCLVLLSGEFRGGLTNMKGDPVSIRCTDTPLAPEESQNSLSLPSFGILILLRVVTQPLVRNI